MTPQSSMKQISDEIQRHLPQTGEARRLFHGRGQCFPGYEDLIIDWFAPVVLVMLYRQRPDEWLLDLKVLLQERLPEMEAVLLQERYLPEAPSRVLWGVLPAQVDAIEGGLRYRLRLATAQNVGFFPDMAVGRQLIRQRSAGKKVLNLFAFSCSFSVAALAGGAEQVVNLDMNRGALELGRLNHQLNCLDLRRCSFLALELFRSIGKLRKYAPFDLVICDPPAAQGRSFLAERDWPKLLRRLPGLLAPGGEILACLNGPRKSPDSFMQLVAAEIPQARLVQISQPGDDFPEADATRGVWLFLYRLAES